MKVWSAIEDRWPIIGCGIFLDHTTRLCKEGTDRMPRSGQQSDYAWTGGTIHVAPALRPDASASGYANQGRLRGLQPAPAGFHT